MILRTSLSCVLLVAVVCEKGAHAQTGRFAPAGSGKAAREVTPPPQAAGDLSGDDALRTGLEILDRLDKNNKQTLSREDGETLAGCIETLRNGDPGNPWLTYLFGRFMSLRGRQGDAITAMRTFVETREGRNNWRAHKILGDFYVAEYPKLAQAEYREADTLKKDDPGVLYGLSLCAFKLGRSDKAADLADRAVAADGRKTVRFVSHAARIRASRQEWDKAVRHSRDAIELARSAIQRAPDEKGLLEALDRQYDLFVDIMRSQLKESPDAADLYVRLADLIGRRAENRRLIARHDELAVLKVGMEATSPNAPITLKQKYGEALAETGRGEEAVRIFKEILAADPTNADAAQWLTRLQSAEGPSQSTP